MQSSTRGGAHLLSTSLMYAEKTRAFMSALPAANNTLFGCQSMERTVDLIGFLRSFETHQSLSSSNEQIAIALVNPVSDNSNGTNETTTQVAPSTTSNSKLVFKRTPPNKSSGAIDIQQHQGWFPLRPARLRIGSLRPHVRVPILRSSDDPVRVRCPIDRRDKFIVLRSHQRPRSLANIRVEDVPRIKSPYPSNRSRL